uniref:Uncharacterized protein n=1 Tax=Kwoniella bestiolae CBS 10118 TaxID=1296100 RepID=A0A1B9FUS1_9TREE|nr:hypothetical protein I302_08167 [Kwoniella bestiolae CBS 10118]OCF22517.1 hypothetical protein I302_08167 [Kwoniella bestiolae CBS 10118]
MTIGTGSGAEWWHHAKLEAKAAAKRHKLDVIDHRISQLCRSLETQYPEVGRSVPPPAWKSRSELLDLFKQREILEPEVHQMVWADYCTLVDLVKKNGGQSDWMKFGVIVKDKEGRPDYVILHKRDIKKKK